MRNPWAPILHIDDAAFPEAVLLQEVPHGCIVPVGIDADVGDPGQAPNGHPCHAGRYRVLRSFRTMQARKDTGQMTIRHTTPALGIRARQ